VLENLPNGSLNEEYEMLHSRAKQLGLEEEARRLKNSYSGIQYHSSNPDAEVRRQTFDRFHKVAGELRKKIKEMEK
jgi:hypothetical protein